MRIGLAIDRFFDPARGGREQWAYMFAQRLAGRGHEVHAASRLFGPAVLRLPLVRHTIASRKPLDFAAAVRSEFEPLRLDVVHDLGTGWYCDVLQPHGGSWDSVTQRKLDLLPAWLRGLKRHIDRVLPRYRQFHALAARQYANRGQVVLALSRTAAAELQRFHAVDTARVRVVYNGVDAARFSPVRCARQRGAMRRQLAVEPHEVLSLLVAQNFRLKGAATLLRAVARLRGEGRPARLAIVGGKRLGSWQRRARRLGIDEFVSLVGQVADPLPYYAAADLYVHPTFYDPCSLVTLEAAACGLPIVTSRTNGAAELLPDGLAARLISDPRDAGELAAAMRPLFEPSVRNRMGAAARRAALAHDFERNVAEILAVYDEVVSRRKTPDP
jgi:UDP-glucose:(heptosyl)LPS alpha-1,3-glucosyltransferase